MSENDTKDMTFSQIIISSKFSPGHLENRFDNTASNFLAKKTLKVRKRKKIKPFFQKQFFP